METSYTNKNRSSIVLTQEPESGEMHRRKKRPSSEVKCMVDKARGRVEEARSASHICPNEKTHVGRL
jgi:hypothetical protein